MKKFSKKFGERSAARLYAVMADYQLTHSSESVDVVINDFTFSETRQESEEFEELAFPGIEGVTLTNVSVKWFEELIRKISDKRKDIDFEIKKNLDKKWTFGRMDPVLVAVLRASVCEILFYPNIPSPVIFKEYDNIAKAFLSNGEVSFVTGILNVIARSHRDASEFKKHKSEGKVC